MIALLRANLHSFSRSKILWKCLLAECLYVLLMLAMDVWLVDCYVKDLPANEYAFFIMDFIDLFTVIITCSIIGTDFHDGTIRNKLIAGYSRTKVYLAGFLTAAVLAVINYLVIVTLGIAIVYPFFGPPRIALGTHIPMLLFGMLSTIVAVAGYHLVCILVQSKNSATVFCLIIGFAAILITTSCSDAMYDRYLLPDTYTLRELPAAVRAQQIGFGDDPSIEQEEWYQEALSNWNIDLDAVIRNDDNLAEPLRKFYLICMDAVPASQISNAVDGTIYTEYHYCLFPQINHVVLLVILNIGQIILFNGIGCLLFRRMKLK